MSWVFFFLATILLFASRPDSSNTRLESLKRRLNNFTGLPEIIAEAGKIMGVKGFPVVEEGPDFFEDVLRIEMRDPHLRSLKAWNTLQTWDHFLYVCMLSFASFQCIWSRCAKRRDESFGIVFVLNWISISNMKVCFDINNVAHENFFSFFQFICSFRHWGYHLHIGLSSSRKKGILKPRNDMTIPACSSILRHLSPINSVSKRQMGGYIPSNLSSSIA